MARSLFSMVSLIFVFQCAEAQSIYAAKSSKVSFFAGTAVEDIDAVNDQSISFINLTTGEVIVSIPNEKFHFRRPLMEEHFNENYMESGKFPKSEFKGKIGNIEKIKWESGQAYDAEVTGVLNIHGVSRSRTIPVHISCLTERLDAELKFSITLADHNIDRPRILWEKLAETVDVHANFTYEPHKK